MDRFAFGTNLAQWRGVNRAVLQKLNEARCRLAFATFLPLAPLLLSLSLLTLLVYRAGRLRFSVLPLSGREIALSVLIPLLAAGLFAFWRWRSRETIAAEIDRRAATKDRLVTYLRLPKGESTGFAVLSAREIVSYVPALRLDQAIRFVAPWRRCLWLLFPIAGLIVLSCLGESRRASAAPGLAKAEKMLETVKRELARQPTPDQQALKDIEKAREDLKASADPLKDAMSALADLENKMSAAGSSDSGLTPEEAAALAKAVASENSALAQQLNNGNQAAAAQEVSKMDPEAVKKALAEAAAHLESNRLRDLARQQASEAQRSLAKIMRASGNPSQGDGSGQRRIASAIQDAKNDAVGDNSAQSGSDQGQAPDSPNGKNQAKSGQSNDPTPGGAAGSDKDSGTGGDITGQRDPQQASPGEDGALTGIQASGPSVVDLSQALGSDKQAAQRAYRAAYQTAAAAALDSVNHEEIPAGSRLLVKRYFESIRPKE